jgi:hypothetical protein
LAIHVKSLKQYWDASCNVFVCIAVRLQS